MLMSASIDPEGTNGGPVVQTFSDPLSAYNTLSWETMPQRLLAAGVKPSSHTISDRTSDHRTGGRLAMRVRAAPDSGGRVCSPLGRGGHRARRRGSVS
ncbi:MAG TPA: hypothetical protein VGM10_08695, partial [Actinocrinis sp.]